MSSQQWPEHNDPMPFGFRDSPVSAAFQDRCVATQNTVNFATLFRD